jgi:hypothetical protein
MFYMTSSGSSLPVISLLNFVLGQRVFFPCHKKSAPMTSAKVFFTYRGGGAPTSLANAQPAAFPEVVIRVSSGIPLRVNYAY